MSLQANKENFSNHERWVYESIKKILTAIEDKFNSYGKWVYMSWKMSEIIWSSYKLNIVRMNVKTIAVTVEEMIINWRHESWNNH